jgi:hypothetical protein
MECYSAYARIDCPERCHYAQRTDGYRNHEHYRCDEHDHTWVYFPDLGTVDWFDLSQPARLIYPVPPPFRNRKR